MGISPFASSDCSCGATATQGDELVVNSTLPEMRIVASQPNPSDFIILRVEKVGKYSVVEVQYANTRNYEGHKILVYKALPEQVRAQAVLDPHFCEGEHLSPFARFKPTEEGWAAAMELVKALTPSAWDRILDDER